MHSKGVYYIGNCTSPRTLNVIDFSRFLHRSIFHQDQTLEGIIRRIVFRARSHSLHKASQVVNGLDTFGTYIRCLEFSGPVLSIFTEFSCFLSILASLYLHCECEGREVPSGAPARFLSKM
jgi:hypothetical protein